MSIQKAYKALTCASKQSIFSYDNTSTILMNTNNYGDFLDLVLEDATYVSTFVQYLAYFILTQKDKPDKRLMEPFVSILCKFCIDSEYAKQAIQKAEKVYCLGVGQYEETICKYLSFCTYVKEQRYCFDVQHGKLAYVGHLKLICAFTPFSLGLYTDKRKMANFAEEEVETLRDQVTKDLHMAFGALVTYKALQDMNVKDGIKHCVLEATNKKNVGIYRKWGFRLGFGPLYDYNKYKDPDDAQLAHKVLTRTLGANTKLSSYGARQKHEQDCEELYIPKVGYRMYIEITEEALTNLRTYLLSKESHVDLLKKYVDSFQYTADQKKHLFSYLDI